MGTRQLGEDFPFDDPVPGASDPWEAGPPEPPDPPAAGGERDGGGSDDDEDWERVRDHRRELRPRHERVLHTRISEELSDDIRRAADDLRVPVSHLVRHVLE